MFHRLPGLKAAGAGALPAPGDPGAAAADGPRRGRQGEHNGRAGRLGRLDGLKHNNVNRWLVVSYIFYFP